MYACLTPDDLCCIRACEVIAAGDLAAVAEVWPAAGDALATLIIDDVHPFSSLWDLDLFDLIRERLFA